MEVVVTRGLFDTKDWLIVATAGGKGGSYLMVEATLSGTGGIVAFI